jgi:hypothetical protein
VECFTKLTLSCSQLLEKLNKEKATKLQAVQDATNLVNNLRTTKGQLCGASDGKQQEAAALVAQFRAAETKFNTRTNEHNAATQLASDTQKTYDDFQGTFQAEKKTMESAVAFVNGGMKCSS